MRPGIQRKNIRCKAISVGRISDDAVKIARHIAKLQHGFTIVFKDSGPVLPAANVHPAFHGKTLCTIQTLNISAGNSAAVSIRFQVKIIFFRSCGGGERCCSSSQ